MSSNFSNDFSLFYPDFATWMENIELILHWDEISYVLHRSCPKLDLFDIYLTHIETYDRWILDDREERHLVDQYA